MKYQLAREKYRYEYIQIVTKTNCTDKVFGHEYEWITKSHEEHDAIRKEHPLLPGMLARCTKCGKVTSST